MADEPVKKSTEQLCYEAYCDEHDKYSPFPHPEWKDVPDSVKLAWEAAVDVVLPAPKK